MEWDAKKIDRKANSLERVMAKRVNLGDPVKAWNRSLTMVPLLGMTLLLHGIIETTSLHITRGLE